MGPPGEVADLDQVDLSSLSSRAFTENRGQLDNVDVRFYAHGGSVWFTDDGVWFDLYEGEVLEYRKDGGDPRDEGIPEVVRRQGVVIKQEFVGCNDVVPEGVEDAGWYANYYYGRDPEGWRSQVPNWNEVWYRDLWDGIDLRYYVNGDGLKYELIVHPGGDVERIALRYEGAEGLEVDGSGDMVIRNRHCDLIDSGLFIFQDMGGRINPIQGMYEMQADDRYGFQVTGRFDPQRDLIIDPQVFGSYIGGGTWDYGRDIEADSSGNMISVGYTSSNNFPTSVGAYDTTHAGAHDVFVAKMDQTASALVFSTYIGGSAHDEAFAVAVDSSDNIYLTGHTSSSDFPTTPGAYDTSTTIGQGIIVKLSSSGASLGYSTFFSGYSCHLKAIDVDSSNNVYIGLDTYTSSFPATPGAYQQSIRGGDDFGIAKLNAAGSQLMWATYVGGSQDEQIGDIFVDSSGATYVTGETRSADFPTTSGAYDTVFNGNSDYAVFKLNPSATSLLYGTFIGGTNWDIGYGISLDPSGNICVAGETVSTDFPTTPGAYSTTFGGGRDIAIVKLNPSGASLMFSTYLGGTDWDRCYCLDTDSAGNIYGTGETDSSDFPVTTGAWDTAQISDEGFMFKLDPSGSTLLYCTYLGGNSYDEGQGIYVDDVGSIYVTGEAGSNFPISSGAYQTIPMGSDDVFMIKFMFGSIFNVSSLTVLKDNEPTSEIYSGSGQYTFHTVLLNTAVNPGLSDVMIRLDPDGEDIQLNWNSSSNQFIEVSDPDDLITLEPASSATNIGKSWIIDFNVTFNWAYDDSAGVDARVHALSSSMKDAWLNRTALFSVENDLEFTGALQVKGESDRILAEDDLVKGGEILNCSGLTVVYEGTTDVFPPPKEYDVGICGETGTPWFDSPGEGAAFSTDIAAPHTTDDDGYTYVVNISGIPTECDATDVDFTVRIDGDNVTFTDPIPSNTTWQTDSDVQVGITIADVGGAMVDGDTVKVQHSGDMGETWVEWDALPCTSDASIDAGALLSMEDGIENLVRWQARDTIGNGPATSEAFGVLVDTGEISFFEPYPGEYDISPTVKVGVGINITDATSGVDGSTVEYAVSDDDGISWGEWISLAGFEDGPLVEVSADVEFLDDVPNMIKWRAWDVAGNGPTESEEYPVGVDTCMAVPIDVSLVSPPNSSTLTESQVELTWTLVETDHPCASGVTYDVYWDTVDPPVTLHREALSSMSLNIAGLEDGQTYHWTVIPRRGLQNGICRSGAWSFTVDLDAEVPMVQLVSPEDGATVNQDSIQLSWEPQGSGLGWTYEILVDEADPPIDPLSPDETGTSILYYDLVDKQTYHWTVVPTNGTMVGKCLSGVWSFTYDKDAKIPEVTLLAPADGEVVRTDSVQLEWEPVGDGTGWKYDVYMGEDDPPTTLKAGGYGQLGVTIEELGDGAKYHWTVVPISAEGVYGVFGGVVRSFTVDQTVTPENYGVALGAIENPEMHPGEMVQITVSVNNTGIFSDTFSLCVQCEGLGSRVSISGSNEVTLGPGASSTVIIVISLSDDTKVGGYPASLTAASLSAKKVELEVRAESAFTVRVVSGTGGAGPEPGGTAGMGLTLLVVLIAVIVAVVLSLLLLILQKRKAPGEGDLKPDSGRAIAVDIVKPKGGMGARPLVATPTQIMDVTAKDAVVPAPTVPVVGATPASTAAGVSVPGVKVTTPLAPGSGAAQAGAGMPADRLLPSGPSPPSKEIAMRPAAGMVAGPAVVPPTAPAVAGEVKIVAPAPAQDKAEVYHHDSGATWTPDMATERTVKESESAMEMLPKLKKMLEDGVITQQEYEISKKRLLRKL